MILDHMAMKIIFHKLVVSFFHWEEIITVQLKSVLYMIDQTKMFDNT